MADEGRRVTTLAVLLSGTCVLAAISVGHAAEEMSAPAENEPLPTLYPASPAELPADSATHEEVEPKSGTVLDMPPASETPARRAISMPEHGMKMAEVERRYGKPRMKHAAVGKSGTRTPPITRWDYPDFSVFFEYSTVLHSVEPDRPAAIQNKDELIPARRSSGGEASGNP